VERTLNTFCKKKKTYDKKIKIKDYMIILFVIVFDDIIPMSIRRFSFSVYVGDKMFAGQFIIITGN